MYPIRALFPHKIKWDSPTVQISEGQKKRPLNSGLYWFECVIAFSSNRLPTLET